ncbi:MAG: hypothetical protein ACKOUT_13950 [Novosphingobium sp.]
MPYAMPMRERCMVLALALSVPAIAFAEASAHPGLGMFDRLVGHCFIASVGPSSTDRHCFEGIYGRKHVRDRHSVKVDGKVVYAGETIYSRDGDSVVFTYFNTLGGVGHGKASATPAGISFTGSMRGSPTGSAQSMDSTWRWQAGGYAAGDGKGADVVFKPAAVK